tara:strand:+ start:560 stop:796 length:237 start_codon:yes stop_codon:yes gene_type:complete
MPRTSNSKNTHYHYELIIDDTKQYIRTCKCLADKLGISLSAVRNKLKNPNQIFRKYKNTNLIINKVKIPIYERKEIEY